MKCESYEDEDLDFFDNKERNGEDRDNFHEEDKYGYHNGEGEYDGEESEEFSKTNIKKSKVLQCDNTSQGDVSSVGGSNRLYRSFKCPPDERHFKAQILIGCLVLKCTF